MKIFSLYNLKNLVNNRNYKQKKYSNRNAFTLAEILIAIVIIGIIAAFTIFHLRVYVNKIETETKVKKFYSNINNALHNAYVKNGETARLDRWDYTYNDNIEWLKKNLLPYLSHIYMQNCGDTNQYRRNAVCVGLADGGVFEFVVDYNGADIFYFPDGTFINNKTQETNIQRKMFVFQFTKRVKSRDDSQIMSTTYIEPFIYLWNGNYDTLFSDSKHGCKKGTSSDNFYCSKVLELNHWKVPDNYPW